MNINRGTLEERILKTLQKKYPITLDDLKEELHISKPVIMRSLKKLQIKKIVELDILPNKVYIRLLRNDFDKIVKKRIPVRPPLKGSSCQGFTILKTLFVPIS